MKDRHILVGVCGGIAAYKVPLLIRLLVKAEAKVQVLATPEAFKFVTPLVLSTLSCRPVLSNFDTDHQWNSHVDLAQWADLLLVAPATANTLAKMVNGYCDNLLLATYLSSTGPIVLAPAMDRDMYLHESTQHNLQLLQQRPQHHLIPPAEGSLASGLEGIGRLQEPEYLFSQLKQLLSPKPYRNKRVLLNAGPTLEDIDAVRFIGNSSSGQMGYALAQTLVEQGAEVTLVSGPNQLPDPDQLHKHVKVRSAEDMYKVCEKEHPKNDVAIFCAAVADYRSKNRSNQKMKKKDMPAALPLVKNPDIAQALGKKKKPHQVHVGFALETDENMASAQQKLKQKNFDMIVLNSLSHGNACFTSSENQITLLRNNEKPLRFPKKPKTKVAYDILHHLLDLLPA